MSSDRRKIETKTLRMHAPAGYFWPEKIKMKWRINRDKRLGSNLLFCNVWKRENDWTIIQRTSFAHPVSNEWTHMPPVCTARWDNSRHIYLSECVQGFGWPHFRHKMQKENIKISIRCVERFHFICSVLPTHSRHFSIFIRRFRQRNMNTCDRVHVLKWL